MPDWLPHAVFLPCVLSVLTHGMLLLVCITVLRSCRQAPVGFSDEETRDIGIVVKEVGNIPDALVPGDPKDGDLTEQTVQGLAQNDLSSPVQSLPDKPPVETSLPRDDGRAQIGPGVNLPTGVPVMDPRQPVKSTGGQRTAATGVPGGVPGTSFMGTRDQGSKVVFVVDASNSMSQNNRMQSAKNALVSSLQALDASQQFLVIFYDDTPTVLHLRDVAKPQLYAATEIHKTLARQKIAGIQPGTGTQHVPALEMALRLQPDVIFFLTDAQDPPIYPSELDKLRQMNFHKTRIHTIEFGVGREIAEAADQNNFLRKLSRQNGGTYRYQDVTKFRDTGARAE